MPDLPTDTCKSPSPPLLPMDVSVLSWVESMLESQREALADQHKELLQELASRLHAMGQLQQCPPPGSSKWQASSQIAPAAPTRASVTHSSLDPADYGDAVSQANLTHEGRVKKKLSPLAALRYEDEFASFDVDGSRWTIMYNRLSKIVSSAAFDAVFVCFIFMNAVVMAFEAQYWGVETGYLISWPGTDEPAADMWPHAEDVFQNFERCFGVVFCLELVVKVVFMRKRYFKDARNILDFLIVTTWLTVALSPLSLPISPMLLRLSRLGRMARLLRLFRLVQAVHLFDSLYLMTAAMRYSLGALFWSMVLMTLVQSLMAFLLLESLKDYILDASKPLAGRQLVYMYYGSFSRCFLTMFEITLGNWMPPCRALVENVSEWCMFFSLFHKMVIGFSCVSVVTAVFMQETFKVSTRDNHNMIISKERLRIDTFSKLSQLFDWADSDDNGLLAYDEFHGMVEDHDARIWLSAMELDVDDPKILFQLLDEDDTGTLDMAEFIKGISRLKGGAKALDMYRLQRHVRNLSRQLEHMQDQIPRGAVSHALLSPEGRVFV